MQHKEQSFGLFLGLAAYGMWGLFPLFFNLLAALEPTQVLLHRVIWSCLFVMLLLTLTKGWQVLTPHLRDARLWRALSLSSLLIAANWLIFIYAVGQHQVLSTSLGYFMTPLVSTALAALFLKEQLTPMRLVAVLLALTAIIWQVFSLGQLPWIAVSLALTFGVYGLIRKQTPIGTLPGLFMETIILLPVALLYWGWLVNQQQSQFGVETNDTLLMVASGIVTALPLLAFAAAAKRLSLMAIGFMMYLNPTLQFLTAVWLFNEPFNWQQGISYGCIWAALVVFSADALQQRRQRKVQRSG